MAKILLVEDDNNLREIYQARLQAEGYDIISARDGEEALVIAKQEMPDLVISDVMMPKISGFEMLDILRNTEGLQQVKVIMLTALGQSEDQSRADNLGADRYLVKSQVTLEDIVNAARDLLVEAGADAAPAAPVATPTAPAAPAAPPVVAAPVAQPAPAVPTEPVAVRPPVIPLATAPPEESDDTQTATTSMPPTPVSVVPLDDLNNVSVAPAAQPAADATQTSAEETAAVEAQIEDFVSSQTGEPEPEVQPVAAPVEVTPETTTPEQEAVLNEALESLGGAESDATAGAAPVAQPEKTERKVVEPLPSTEAAVPANNLEQLLAAEAADDAVAETNVPPAAPAPTPAPAPVAEPAPSQPVPAPEQRPAQPAQPAQQKPPAANNDFDPNSIAL